MEAEHPYQALPISAIEAAVAGVPPSSFAAEELPLTTWQHPICIW